MCKRFTSNTKYTTFNKENYKICHLKRTIPNTLSQKLNALNVELCCLTLFCLYSELQNANSFTQSKALELNFTPRKVRQSQQFWYFIHTKLTKKIALENKYWQLYQIRLVWAEKSYISCASLTKIGLIWPNYMFSQTF